MTLYFRKKNGTKVKDNKIKLDFIVYICYNLFKLLPSRNARAFVTHR